MSESAFIAFAKTGQFGLLHPDMDVGMLRISLPNATRWKHESITYIGDKNLEISMLAGSIEQVKVTFRDTAMVFPERQHWVDDLAVNWYSYLRKQTLTTVAQALQQEAVAHTVFSFDDGSYAIELVADEYYILLTFLADKKIEALRIKWQKPFTTLASGEGGAVREAVGFPILS